ncbi:hypothetical protein R1sor_014449 [Riccia sorocarpa]|uniref:Uncharacterized protein n=1 Tax=Riccia sorocarpa TaxID=122646 RepID=A0ABD3H9F0_9MARC
MGGDPSPADERRREKKRFAQRKRRYDQSVNSLKAELDAMRKAAESEIEEIKKRAFEEADSIRESARGDIVGACGASTMTSSHEAQTNSTVVGRNDADEASSILRFAQAFATEVRDEATRVLANARAEAEQLLSNARANGVAVPSSGSATIADREKMRREREASRKQRKYWETRSWPDDSTKVQKSAVVERDKGDWHIRRIMSEAEIYLAFKAQLDEMQSPIQIGFRSFQKLKPFYIRTMQDRNVCCCKQHVEMDLLKDALNGQKQARGGHKSLIAQVEKRERKEEEEEGKAFEMDGTDQDIDQSFMDIPPDVRARREKDALRKRKARYDQTVNSKHAETVRAKEALQLELARITEEALQELGLMRERATEEAHQIRNDAIVAAEKIVNSALQISAARSMQNSIHLVLEQAKMTAKELVERAQSEANRLRETVLLEANSGAADILECARVVAHEVETQALQRAREAWEQEAADPDLASRERLKRAKDATRKRREYWKEKEQASEPGVRCDIQRRGRKPRTSRLVSTELVQFFNKKTEKLDLSSKRMVCEKFWLHPSMKNLQPSSVGCAKLDYSIAKGFLGMKEALQKVKGAQRNDHRNSKYNSLIAVAGSEVVKGRYQSTLARALGVKRENIYKAAKARATLDSDSIAKFPTGRRKERSDKISQEVRLVVEAFWRSKSRVSPRMKDKVRKRISKNVYETTAAYWLVDTEVDVAPALTHFEA